MAQCPVGEVSLRCVCFVLKVHSVCLRKLRLHTLLLYSSHALLHLNRPHFRSQSLNEGNSRMTYKNGTFNKAMYARDFILSPLCLPRISPQWHGNRTCHTVRARGYPQGGHQLRPLQDHLSHLRLWEPRHFLLRSCGGALSLSNPQA